MEEDDNHSEDFEDFDSQSQEEQIFYTQNVVFPEPPSQLDKLFQIFKRNVDKIESLRKSNRQKQQFIALNKGMKNQEEKDQLDDEYSESPFLVEYTKTRKIRQDELKTLKQIYGKLNIMILDQVIQGNEDLYQQLKDWIRIHKNIAHYHTTHNYLVILTKEIIITKPKAHKPVNLNLSLNKKIKSGSSGDSKKMKSCKEDKQKSQIFTIRLMNIHHYVSRLKSAMERFHIQDSPILEVYNQEQLEAKKKQIINDVNLVTLIQVKIQNGAMFKKIAYHEALNIFILTNDKGKIAVLNKQGKQLCSVFIDGIDQIILLQMKGEELWVGTQEGVVRVYKINGNELSLLNMYSCFNGQSIKVDAYYIQSTQKIDRLIFYIKNEGFYLYRKDHRIVKFGDILDTPIKQIGQFIISNTNIHIYHPKDQLKIVHHHQMTTWLTQFKSKNPRSTIIWLNKQRQTIQILVSDPHGNNQLIIL